MTEVLLTSSVLILALLLLRRLFRGLISRRFQYALWLLVLVRLLIPVNLPEAEFSLLTAAEPAAAVVTQRMEQREIYLLPQETFSVSAPTEGAGTAASYRPAEADGDIVVDADTGTAIRYAWTPTLPQLLACVWAAGAAGMACWFLFVNLRFSRRIRKVRMPYTVEGCKYPVYLVESGLPSPCLFGLIRPAIYLTPAAAAPQRLRHVIAHESAHARHADPLWALLRGLCLAVYWFDPLVWLAAAASRADGELACDEAALAVLGPAERVPYGQTLLALIPVRRGSDPMLSATTMTAGKRQLRERMARIAEDRRTRWAALLAVAALAAGVCAVTFTGAGKGSFQPLTSQELTWFNQDFFHQGDEPCLPDQFLTSLYDSPEEIDLYQLFYNGTGEASGMDEAERQQAADAAGGDPGTDLVKFTTAGADTVLERYTGLTLAQTREIGLDRFTYLESTDAYYLFHGDTNAPADIAFAAGERRGSTVRLYYDAYGSFLGDQLADSWACVTLEEQGDGTYWFVSHQLCDMPAIPTIYPDWEPVLTLPASDLTAYEPQAAEVVQHSGDLDEELDFYLWEQVTVEVYRSTDGSTYAACAPASSLLDAVYTGEKSCFFTFPAEAEHITLGGFRDVMGSDGVMISYQSALPGQSGVGTVNDYYIFDEGFFSGGGTPALLARAYGSVAYIDLNGDGETELCASSGSTAQVFFRRDGGLYEADLGVMLAQAWPEAQDLAFSEWDASGRYLPFSAQVSVTGTQDHRATAFRWLYFSGDGFPVYRDQRSYTDHVAQTISAPDEVLEQARTYVRQIYETPEEGRLLQDGEFTAAPVVYDDWRICSLTGPFLEETAGVRVEIWCLDYQLHTTTPDTVVLAGGRYMTEDGWVSAAYPDCDYFYFRAEEDGTRTYLFHQVQNDCFPGTELFRSDLINTLSDMGILSLAYLPGQTLLEMMEVQPAQFLERLAQHALWEQAQAIASLAQTAAGAEERMEACARRLEDGEQTLSAEASEAWSVLQAAADSWTAAGSSILTNSRLGVSLQVPAGWEGLAEVFSGGSGLPAPVFSLYEQTAHSYSPGMGLVWNLTAFTRDAFEQSWPDADGSEVLGVSSYLIGADDQHMYLLSTPTDIQFLLDTETTGAESLRSCVAYATLQAQSQQVLEDFLVRNDIAPNPLCPDADGCYRYTGSLIVTPEKEPEDTPTAAPSKLPTDADIRSALLADYVRVNPAEETEDTLVYQTEAHRLLAQESDGNTCTFYLTAWRCTFTLTDGRYASDSGDRIPTALTYTWDGQAWRLSEYWIPGDGAAYARDLREKFPPEAAEQELDADTLNANSQELQEQCRRDAVEYFTRLTGSVPSAAFQASDVEFTGLALETAADAMSYEERLAWAEGGWQDTGGVSFAVQSYLAGEGCLAYTGNLAGGPPDASARKELYLRFSDGTLAELPLPREQLAGTAFPDAMSFSGGRFTYEVRFEEEASEGQTLYHLAGTYRYVVDLNGRTVSLTVLER